MRSALALAASLAIAAPGLDAQSTPQASASTGEGRRQAQAARTAQPPHIDGVLDDDAWRQAQPITDLIQRAPNPGAPSTLPTEARILYDDGAVYVAMRMHDPAPDSMVAPLGRRDLAGISSEWAHVMIDSYNDKRTAFRFSVNPRGVQKDAFHSNDTNEDLGWDAVWESAARVDSAGWTVEYRIPLSQLRYSGTEGEQTWGIQVSREIARRSEIADWSAIRPDRNGFVSQFGEVSGIRGIRSARRLEVLPYSVARVTRAPGSDADPFWNRNDGFGSVGADVKYGLTSDLTLTATINPDFGQVEADPSEVNLSAFETFFQERRPFFTEGSDIFGFDVGFPYGVRGAQFGNDQPFYSRRLGRQPQGGAPGNALFTSAPEATTILGAAKLSGKTRGGWSIGLLDAVTAREDVRFLTADGRDALVAEPRTNYAVGRVIKDFNGGRSAIGAIATATHRDLDGADALSWLPSSAYLAGIDGRHRFGGNDYEVSGAVMGTHVAGTTDAITAIQTRAGHYYQRPDADHLSLDPDATTLDGWMARGSVEKVGGGHWRGGVYTHARSPGLEMNDLGYVRNADWALAGARLGYVEFRPGRVVRGWEAGLHGWSGWSFGGERLSTGMNAGTEIRYQNNWGQWMNVNHEFQALRADVLRGGPSFVGPAYSNFETGFWTDGRRRVSADAWAGGWNEWGTSGGGWFSGANVNVRPTSRIQLSAGPRVNVSHDPWIFVAEGRTQAGASHYVFGDIRNRSVSLSTRVNYAFTPRLTLELYAQPFVAAGEYGGFKEVADGHAETFGGRFRVYAEGTEIDAGEPDAYGVRLDGAGEPDFTFGNPDFNFEELRTNAVLRWEYRPGSALFVVWSHGRSHFGRDGSFQLDRDVGRLFDDALAPPTNVLLVKVNYWLNL
ncbi:DUF5916 domain-containing protein [Longimicrobium sp.]|uniref:DUF5916 domain-containing protein n=1 Tax=Longimicrobium sp. TaxID=2029185 RepID=UPI002E2F1188|nr:DUF5916 domain-containing protein [Longimicrobium sp.]HEX6038792.1 DUF5916 domain-containing protein [Longimicrobium sp.]